MTTARRRVPVALSAIAVAAVALAACAPGGGGGSGATTPGGEQTSAAGDPTTGGADDAPVTITWWDYYQDEKSVTAVEALIAQYQDEHPNVTIEREFVAYADLKQTLLQSAGAAALPDLVVINSPDHQQFAELGIAADLTDRLAEWGQLDKYPEGIIASATYEDRIYGLPITTNCLSLFYNKAYLEEAGVEPPTTWEELTSAAAALTTPEHYGLAFSAVNNQQAVFQWLPTLWQAGGDLTDVGSPEAVSALDFWGNLVTSGSVSQEALNWDQTMVKDDFAQGRSAMMINGPWQMPALAADAPDLDYGVALLPVGKEAASALGGENYMVIDGPEAEASWQLLEWLQDPARVAELAASTGSLPTRTDVEPFSDDPNLAVFTEQLGVAKPRAYGSNYAEIADQVVIAIQSVLTGQQSAADALPVAASAIAPLLP